MDDLTVFDLGNNESVAVGITEEADGEFVALTRVDSKTFKTRKGAENWLMRRGYVRKQTPTGTRWTLVASRL